MKLNRQTPQPYSNLLQLTNCRHGRMLYFPHDVYIGGALEAYGEYAEVECQFLCKMLSEGSTVIEAGANIGTLTLPMAKRVGMAGRVYAYEPQRIIFNMLCANIALNVAWNIHAKHSALGAASTELGVPFVDYTQPGNFGGVSLSFTSMPEMVPVQTIDSLELIACRLIKADVQGMESAVLTGALQTIARCKPFLYVENDDDTNELPKLMVELGYDVYEHKTPLFNPDNWRSERKNHFPNIVSYNILGVPHEFREYVTVQLKSWEFAAHKTGRV
jgi:FkbM family methyltransferase